MTLSVIQKMQELQTILIFGIGSLFLYLVVPVALFANEVRLAKQSDDTSGTAAIFNSLIQAFFYIVAWSIFVSIIVFLVIKLGHGDATNPAVGIDRFWNIEWLDKTKTIDVLDTSVFPPDTKQLTQAKLIVMIVTWAKALEYMLLGVLLALTLKLTMSLPLLKMRRADHYKMTSQIDVGTMMSTFMTGILGWVIFSVIIGLESTLLTSLIQKDPSATVVAGQKIKVLDDLKKLLYLGMTKLQ